VKKRARAVFVDRDGVLIRDRHYLGDPGSVKLYAGVPAALKALRRAGFKVVVVSNQSGVARGYLTRRQVDAVHARLKALLARAGAKWDALYYSPYGPDSGHPWRKPGTGMLQAARRRFGLDLRASYLVGDKTSDIECARRAGCAGVLVRTGKGGRDREFKARPAFIARGFSSAARWVLSRRP
jgi:histidinol-phosphate phosphatase family protein